MARNEPAKRRQGSRVVNGRVKPTRSASEVGTYGNSRPRDDQSVRRAREKANDPRLQRAAQEAADHEAKLRSLEEELAARQREEVAAWVKASTAAQGVPEKVTDPATIQKVAVLLGASTPKPPVPEPVVAELARIVALPPDQFDEHLRTPSAVDMADAKDLLCQGYHIDRVAVRTGVPADWLAYLVGPDGYVT